MEKSILLTAVLAVADQTSVPASVDPSVIEETTVNPVVVGGEAAAMICQPALAFTVVPFAFTRTTNECTPILRPLYVTGLVHVAKLAPSRLQSIRVAFCATKATVAVVLVVGLAGLLVMATVGEADAAPAWARATARVTATRRHSPKTVP